MTVQERERVTVREGITSQKKLENPNIIAYRNIKRRYSEVEGDVFSKLSKQFNSMDGCNEAVSSQTDLAPASFSRGQAYLVFHARTNSPSPGIRSVFSN